ncbi:MAG: acyltransferase domain-containing protein, partial [Clostridiales bacterium]|nr:acyltransferase domain-containing protein [Clostridiales bacterium]
MGKSIVDSYPASAEIFDKASAALGLDMRKMVFEGTEDELKITENTQPSILTTSIACLAPLFEKGLKPAAVAGLSLGEYSA